MIHGKAYPMLARRAGRLCEFAVLSSALWCGLSASALAGDLSRRMKLDIPAQPLESALSSLAHQADVQILFAPGVAVGVSSAPVDGEMSAREALDRLLKSTALEFSVEGPDTVAVRTRKVRDVMPPPPAGGADATETNTLDEVIVTAQKRQERLQDVPISITALSEESLQRTGADRFQDYISQVGGAFYEDAGQGRSRINIRSIQTTQVGSFEEGQSPTAIYIDDFPSLNLSNPWASTDLRLYDVQRVEVLRGPQGTLFGSGALGGAVRIITNKPDVSKLEASFESSLENTRGGDESERFDGMLNLPLIADKLALRAVAYYRNDGGYIDNTFRNEKNVNHGDSNGGRLMLQYLPTDQLSLRFTFTHQNDFSADAPRVNLNGHPSYDYDGQSPAYTEVRLNSFNLAADYDLGPALLTSSTTYSDSYSDLGQGLGQLLQGLFNWNSAPGATFHEDNAFTAKTWAEEFRATSQHSERFKWVVGGFYLHQDLGQHAHWYASTQPNMFSWSIPALAKERAVFGEASYSPIAPLTLTAGVRVSKYDNERHVAFANGSFATLNSFGPTPVQAVTQSAVTPKFAAAYKVSDDVMFYLQAAKGFRMGQANATAGGRDPVSGFVIPDGYKSDKLWNYEGGIKSEWLDRRLRVNASVFYIDWKDIPLLRFAGALSFTDNAGSAYSRGFELEVKATPIEHVEIGLSDSYADAKLYAVLPGVPYVRGDRLPGTPKISSSNYVQYSTEGWIPNGLTYFRLGHRYAGKIIDNLDNQAGIESDSYNVFDARAGVSFDKFEVALYAENLADSDKATSRSINALYLNPNGFEYRLRPRTIGVTFRAHY